MSSSTAPGGRIRTPTSCAAMTPSSADELLGCHLDRWQAKPHEQRFTARNRILFVNGVAAYRGNPSAWRALAFPRGHKARESDESRQSLDAENVSAGHPCRLLHVLHRKHILGHIRDTFL